MWSTLVIRRSKQVIDRFCGTIGFLLCILRLIGQSFSSFIDFIDNVPNGLCPRYILYFLFTKNTINNVSIFLFFRWSSISCSSITGCSNRISTTASTISKCRWLYDRVYRSANTIPSTTINIVVAREPVDVSRSDRTTIPNEWIRSEHICGAIRF